jgi:hypothetical protein
MRVNSKTSSSPGRAPLIHTLCLKQCCNSPPHTQISLSNHSTEKISFSIPGPKWITEWERNIKNNLSYCQTLFVPSLVPALGRAKPVTNSQSADQHGSYPLHMQPECNWIVTWHSHNGWVKCKWNANLINIKAAQNTPFCMTQQYTIRGVMEDPPKPLKLPSPWCDSTAIRIQLENMETALGKTTSMFNPLNQQALIILQVIRCYHQGPEMTLLFLPFEWSSLITILSKSWETVNWINIC